MCLFRKIRDELMRVFLAPARPVLAKRPASGDCTNTGHEGNAQQPEWVRRSTARLPVWHEVQLRAS